jgi:hypothetical protein
MKKHKLLDTYGAGIYDDLHKLRKYRNKVHIQDNVDIEGVDRNEHAPELHPNLPVLYRRRVGDLEQALTRSPAARAHASEILRSLISGIIVYPGGARGKVRIRVEGSIPAILDFARQRERAPNGRERTQNRSVTLMVPREGTRQPQPKSGDLHCGVEISSQ